MVERCNVVLISGEGRDTDQMVEALTTVWLHTLYPDPVAASP
jgi:hypothetical protein